MSKDDFGDEVRRLMGERQQASVDGESREKRCPRIVVKIGFMQILLLLLVGLKLGGAIDWSWWWVLSPIWLPIAASIAFIVMAVTVIVIFYAIMSIFVAFTEQ